MTKKTHGMWGTPTYRSWLAMRHRCQSPNMNGYENYGGRGIRVCDDWEDFVKFLEDMGPRPDGMTLDRIDPDGHYEKSNCRWETNFVQQRNKRRYKKRAA